MALTTFQGLYQEVLDHGFGSSRYLQFAKDKVNEGQLEIAKRFDLRILTTNQTATTSIGTGTIGLSSNFLRIAYVYETTNDDAQLVLSPLPNGNTLENLDRLERGRPQHWFVQGSSLLMYPVPDAAYAMVVRYIKQPTTMTADGDVPEIPVDLRPAIISYAVALCYRREQDLAAYQSFMADFNRQLMESARQNTDVLGEHAQQVAGMW